MQENISRRDKEKQTRKGEIINSALKIFCSRGFEGSSMDDIAKDSQFTKRTVYQYFVNKEDLFFAVLLKAYGQLHEDYRTAIEKGKNGFEKFKFSGFAFYRFFKEYPEVFRLINYTGFIKTGDEIVPHRRIFMEEVNSLLHDFTDSVELGKKDGSIRTDIDSLKLTYSSAFMMNGFFYMLSVNGNSLLQNMDIDEEDFVNFSLNLLGNTIKKARK